jgi:hypothetical protein
MFMKIIGIIGKSCSEISLYCLIWDSGSFHSHISHQIWKFNLFISKLIKTGISNLKTLLKFRRISESTKFKNFHFKFEFHVERNFVRKKFLICISMTKIIIRNFLVVGTEATKVFMLKLFKLFFFLLLGVFGNYVMNYFENLRFLRISHWKIKGWEKESKKPSKIIYERPQ